MISPRLRRFCAGMLLPLALLISGCGASTPELTATAAQGMALTELDGLRATGTVVRARMQTTLDYASARGTQAAEAREFLRFNLISLGTESAFIATAISQLGESSGAASATAPANAAGHAAPAAATASAADIIITPPATARAGPRLEDLVMASGVDGSDCARDRNPRFTPASSEIYVVARAYQTPVGATISSVWRRGGDQVAEFSFQPRHAIDGNCIWFFIDQTDAEFTVGAWSVELSVDGESAGPALAFEISP